MSIEPDDATVTDWVKSLGDGRRGVIADLPLADRKLIDQWINESMATERPQGARVVWRHDATRIAHNAYGMGETAGHVHGLRSAAAAREVADEAASATTADVARLAAMNVEVLDRLSFALFSGHRSDFADLQAHVRQVLDDMNKMAERLRGHRVPPSDAGKRVLALLADRSDSHPTPGHLVGLAVEAGIADSVAARDLIDFLWNDGWIESFKVDDITFLALEGKRPKLEDLPKAGDEIVMVSGDAERLAGEPAGEATPRCSEGDIAEMMAGQYAPKGEVTP